MTTSVLKNRSIVRHGTATTALAHTWSALRLWRERARQRTHLAELSPQMLKDVGISSAAARAEASRPFWLA